MIRRLIRTHKTALDYKGRKCCLKMTCASNNSLVMPSLSGMALLLFFLAADASAGDSILHYDISAQPLSNALVQFAADSNLELIVKAETLQGFKSNGLVGNFTTEQALTQLLQGSGMMFRFVDAGTVTVESAPINLKESLKPQSDSSDTGSEITLPKVKVVGSVIKKTEYYTDPYNKDYVIPNATAGTKTDTPIMETPLNVQVISKQVLKDQQVITLGDALKNVSGVVTRTNTAANEGNGILGGTQQSIFLRGFESQTFFRNGFRLQEGSASKGLANVESVEVLKGPAAILYGLVEPGGLVNVITKQPLATPYYGFTQQFGSYDLYRTTLDATGPITKNKDLLYRVNMSYENSGSFRDLVGKEDVFFAPVLKWNISPQTQATFELEYNHQHLGTDNGFVPFFNGQPLNVPLSRNLGEYSPATTETIFGGFNWSHQFNDDWSIKHRFSANQSSVSSPFGTRPFIAGNKTFMQTQIGDNSNLGLLPDGLLVARDNFSSFTQKNTYSTNLDLIGHFDTVGLKHTLLFGGDYYRLDSDSGSATSSSSEFSFISLNNPVHPGTPVGHFDQSEGEILQQTDQYGLYIQDQIKLPYGFQVMGGIRYQNIHQKNISEFAGQSTISSASQDAVTPRVGLLWQPQNWLSLYANYVESFGANTGNAFVRTGVSTVVPPTSANQYEGGIKAEFFDGKLRANLAYYDLSKTNVAVADLAIDPTTGLQRACGAGPGSCSLAIGAVRSRGPELDITGEILPGWNMIATWANTDIIVTSNDIPLANGGSYTAGSRLPNVPRNIGRLWSTYEVQNGDYKGLTFGGGVNLRDSQLPANDVGLGTGGYKLPGYATCDLMARYSRKLGDAKVSIQLNVNNLLDYRYFTNLSAWNNLHGSFADFGQPRTFMGQISVQY